MNYYAELFLNLYLDKSIPPFFYNHYYGKIFYLMAEYLIHGSGNHDKIIYFYEVSKQIL